ncbi:hypothetical protein ACH4E7_37225 [Kitasatospora sp. NPDC018058]|uniref:hypothetical protein n=1 Tax=Kitasatospora sp. NPDC018058 TaxID=3364025 RepID=UPI0037BFBBE1
MLSRIKLAVVAAGISTLAVAGLAGPAAADGSYDPGKETLQRRERGDAGFHRLRVVHPAGAAERRGQAEGP